LLVGDHVKAIVYHEYGAPNVLRCEDIEKPAPGDGEVLLKVYAASLNPYDWHFMRGEPYAIRLMAGFSKPKNQRLGADVAGVVEAVNPNVTQWKPGDPVWGVSRCVRRIRVRRRNKIGEEAGHCAF
jgi:NADPH:quinone reductase-like Zn-dependent oxidoreductase